MSGIYFKAHVRKKLGVMEKVKNNWDNVDNCWSWVMDISDFAPAGLSNFVYFEIPNEKLKEIEILKCT